MASRIEDYALIGDCQTAALVGRDGSIDWLCLPRFHSGACFAALLGTPEHGRWQIAPAGEARRVRRHYREGTLVLETEFETDDGVVALIDFMPPRGDAPDLIRVVEGRRGQVLESNWHEPDDGIWELGDARRHYTHSKLMAWVAFDRAVESAEQFGLDGPVDRWRALRDEVHAQVCREGFDPDSGAFVQAYGTKRIDTSLLMMPLVGFLPATDLRVRGTVAAIERTLDRDGFVARFEPMPEIYEEPEESAFLLCSFWLVDNYQLQGRHADARRLFERLLDLRNDVGLLSERYDPKTRRLVGNYPQAFSHVGLVNSAYNLASDVAGPAEERGHA